MCQWKKNNHCWNLALFHYKYCIDNGQSLSNVTIDHKRYEYINYATSSTYALSKRIDL